MCRRYQSEHSKSALDPTCRRVPQLLGHSTPHLNHECIWLWGMDIPMSMALPIAPSACCSDVGWRVPSAILLRDEMLCGGLQIFEHLFWQLQSFSKPFAKRLLPDGQLAIDAPALLRKESSCTELDQFFHGHLNSFEAIPVAKVWSGRAPGIVPLGYALTCVQGGRGRRSPDGKSLPHIHRI